VEVEIWKRTNKDKPPVPIPTSPNLEAKYDCAPKEPLTEPASKLLTEPESTDQAQLSTTD
jgi:hypothetical protein